jgi:hypothetical protein
MLEFLKVISFKSINIVKDNNEYFGIYYLLKWPRYYNINQVKIVVMAEFTQDRISPEPCVGMEYQKGHTFIISLSQGIFHWPKLNSISPAWGIILYILFVFPFPRACDFKPLRKNFLIPSTSFLILSIVFFIPSTRFGLWASKEDEV